jgi:hypothetical protein
MIGIDKLLDIRKDGYSPEVVNIWVGDDSDPFYEGVWHKYSDTMQYPALLIENKDNLDAIDFRFAYGLTLFIRGDNSERMLKVYEKINKCKPSRVFIFNCGKVDIEILDSEGLLSGIIAA